LYKTLLVPTIGVCRNNEEGIGYSKSKYIEKVHILEKPKQTDYMFLLFEKRRKDEIIFKASSI